MYFKCSRRSLPQLHCMAASFVHIRSSSSAKGNLLKADIQLQVETPTFIRQEVSEAIACPWDWLSHSPMAQSHLAAPAAVQS